VRSRPGFFALCLFTVVASPLLAAGERPLQPTIWQGDCHQYYGEAVAIPESASALLKGATPSETKRLYEAAFLLQLTQNKSLLEIQIRDKIDALEKAGLSLPHLVKHLGSLVPSEERNEFLGRVLALARSEIPDPAIRFSMGYGLPGVNDRLDLLRGYGYRILSEKNPAHSDPKYLFQTLQYSGRGVGAAESNSRAYSDYMKQWRETLGNNTEPILFTQTGSDANSLIFDVLAVLAKQRGKPELVLGSFENIYGAGRGLLSGTGTFAATEAADRGPSARGLILKEVPYIQKAEKELSTAELAAIRIKEDQFFEQLKRLKTESNLGAILLETMAARVKIIAQEASGTVSETNWLTFRRDFMKRLREFCTKEEIVIVADEIMNFARVGSPYSWDYFPGFQPDFFTFGKGSVIAGIAQVRPEGSNRMPFEITSPYFEVKTSDGKLVLESVTVKAPAASLLAGTQVLKAIKDQNLFRQSKEVGDYLRDRLVKAGYQNVQGMGMHISAHDPVVKVDGKISLAEKKYDRLLPPIDLTKKDVDWIFDWSK
jgi:4-aminobutyrate aminotransferase-like enzyme